MIDYIWNPSKWYLNMTEQSETVSVELDRDVALNIWCNLYNEADLTERQWEAIKESLMHALAQPLKSTQAK